MDGWMDERISGYILGWINLNEIKCSLNYSLGWMGELMNE
jgi:hypothetical protein